MQTQPPDPMKFWKTCAQLDEITEKIKTQIIEKGGGEIGDIAASYGAISTVMISIPKIMEQLNLAESEIAEFRQMFNVWIGAKMLRSMRVVPQTQ